MLPKPGPQAPVAPATGNPGNVAAGMAKVREAISILEQVLPELPTGDSQHKAVLESLTKLSKEFPASAAIPGVQRTALAGLAQKANSDAMLRQVMAAQQAKAQQPPPPQAGAPGMSPQPAM